MTVTVFQNTGHTLVLKLFVFYSQHAITISLAQGLTIKKCTEDILLLYYFIIFFFKMKYTAFQNSVLSF